MAIDWINAIDRHADLMIEQLPERSDEEIVEIRSAARAGGRALWRIEAACDAAILDRVKLRGGRGKKDEEAVGVDAAVRKVAADLGVTPRTIYQNAQIHKTFFDQPQETTERAFSSLGPVDHLEEKEYFKAALRSPDPHETIEYFARQKAADPNFSTGDAWRIVKNREVPALQSELPPVATEEVMQSWRAWCRACDDKPSHANARGARSRCPRSCTHLLQDCLITGFDKMLVIEYKDVSEDYALLCKGPGED
ncbi:MAG: hypothetical protein EB117_12430 [Betaproteobacteria bacterium]|nr:hypothetical protein [Betaproteobacteria bacterium]